MNSRSLLFEVTNLIPTGRVASYGQIGGLVSQFTGKQIRGQVAGFFLSGMNESDSQKYAWHRVVAQSGAIPADKLGFRGAIQRQKLVEEGVIFQNGLIDMAVFCLGWQDLQELERQVLTKFYPGHTLTTVK